MTVEVTFRITPFRDLGSLQAAVSAGKRHAYDISAADGADTRPNSATRDFLIWGIYAI